jgi:hypothetical protein
MRWSPVALALLFAAPSARADASPLALSWSAPSDCPGEAAVSAGALRLVPPSARAREPLRARGVVSKDVSGLFHGEVEISSEGQSSKRTIDGESCAAVSDAMELMLAIAIDPDAALPEAPPPRPAPAPPREPLVVVLGGAFALGSGTFGGAAPGAEIDAGVMYRRFLVEATGTWLAARHATLADRPAEGASAWQAHAGARACYMLFGGALDVGPCAAAGVAWIVAQGFGSTQPQDRTATVFVPALGLRGALALSSGFALRAGAEAALLLPRPTFVIDNAGTLERSSVVTLRIAPGAVAHF